jgi:hypothetical protein
MEVKDEAHTSTQIHRKNRRKTPQIVRSKIPPKITKKKNIATQGRR